MATGRLLGRRTLGVNMFGLLVMLVGTLASSMVGSNASVAQTAATAAEDPDGAVAFITELSDNAIAVLNDTTVDQNERDNRFRDLLREGFALEYISKLVLGRHRRAASKAQLDEYLDVFPEYVLKIYSGRLTEFGDEEFVVLDTAPAGKKDLYVRSQIVRPEGPPVAADWRVRVVDDTFKIIDLKIEGISMAITQRDEFSARIATIGLDGLIAELRDGAGLNVVAEGVAASQ